MSNNAERAALEVFQRASQRVPAYQTILAENGLRPDEIKGIDDFRRLPILDKRSTFLRFDLPRLCMDGQFGDLASVLTSSGHSGLFAFGLTDRQELDSTTAEIDEALDMLFGVRACPSLLINCLPMGVKVPTRLCALAETSVRPDMVVALVKAFGPSFGQIILIGDAAFVKLTLELGEQQGIDWRPHRVHIVLGEETLAENARKYLHGILGTTAGHPQAGLVFSSMGIAEIGLNLFFEAPPAGPLITLRQILHERKDLRREVFGDRNWLPSLFTYDPRRMLVEIVEGDRLVLTTLSPTQRVPLVRYAPGDQGRFLELPESIKPDLRSLGCAVEILEQLPIVAIFGRGQHVKAGEQSIHPEAIKEGVYHDSELARMTTANFRLASARDHALVRIQLSPGVSPEEGLNHRFAEAIRLYAEGHVRVVCQSYAEFSSGMRLDYERKFDYLGS